MKDRIKLINKKYIVLLGLQLLLCILLLPGCFAREAAVCSISGDSLGEGTPVENGWEYRIAGPELSPGVYRVRLQCIAGQNQGMYAEVYADAAYYKSILGNGVTVFAGTDETDYEIYVTDRIAQTGIRLQVYGTEDPSSALTLLEVYRTPLGSRILLFLAIVFFVLLDALILWRGRILAGKVTAEGQLAVWGLIATTLIAALPYLADYFYGGADTYFHILRFESLSESLQSGLSWPIRIQDYWLYGHGYAISFFYGDLLLFFPALLRLIGFPVAFAYTAFLAEIHILTYLVFYFSARRCVGDRRACIVAAMVYALVPYRIYDCYFRGAMGECTAMIFMPLVFAGMYLLYTADPEEKTYRNGKWYLVIGLTCILQCHILSTEFTLIAIIITCVIFLGKDLSEGDDPSAPAERGPDACAELLVLASDAVHAGCQYLSAHGADLERDPGNGAENRTAPAVRGAQWP